MSLFVPSVAFYIPFPFEQIFIIDIKCTETEL